MLDASAVIELLLGTDAGKALAERISPAELSLNSPHLLDVEVAQVLRRYVRDRDVEPTVAHRALVDLQSLDIERHSHEPLLERVWSLKENLTAYDAVYVSLAEALEATLLTCDRRLARAPGTSCSIELID